MMLRRLKTPTRPVCRLLVDVLEDRSLLSASAAFLETHHEAVELNDDRPAQVADRPAAVETKHENGRGMGPHVRQWTHQGVHGRTLAQWIEQYKATHRDEDRSENDDKDDRDDDRPNKPVQVGRPVVEPSPHVGRDDREDERDESRPERDEDTPAARPVKPSSQAFTSPPRGQAIGQSRSEHVPPGRAAAEAAPAAEDDTKAVLAAPGRRGPTAVVRPTDDTTTHADATEAVAVSAGVTSTAGRPIVAFLGEPADVAGAAPVDPADAAVIPIDGQADADVRAWADAAPITADADAAYLGAMAGAAFVEFLPLGLNQLSDLSASPPDMGALQGIFDYFGGLAGSGVARAGLPWLTAAGMTVLACEIARRQMKPAAGEREAQADPDDPAFGWLPDDNLPRGNA